MKEKYCQSCAMPMTEEFFAVNADGTRNEAYCRYCMEKGKFTQDCTMEEMMDFSAKIAAEEGAFPDVQTARVSLAAVFPKLQRWRKD